MPYELELSSDAVADIDQTFDHYNKATPGSGFEFINVLDRYLENIILLPTASSIKYEAIRVKPMSRFPFTIHYIISGTDHIIILRIFDTRQQPFW